MSQTPSSPGPQGMGPQHYADDEISLVDLAKLLIRRWKAMVVIFLVVVFGALAYALMQTPAYTYTSIYSVAEAGGGDALETPASLVARTENLYLGPVTRELIEAEGLTSLPFSTRIANPDNTHIVRLSSTAPEAQAERVQAHHQALLERLKADQDEALERRRNALERQLSSLESTFEQGTETRSMGAAEIVSGALQRMFEVEAELEELEPGEVVQVAVQSLEQQGTNRKLILALGVVLGGMLAVMGVFFLHFASLVRQSLREESSERSGEKGSDA
ncbi:Wzz/FepE/Etk N-terminal domain-containing protein [Halomonas faecis]|uniref:Wzz/FepE/Etk N-terminal domain-containing protein n=1 Tax=Halomonas faecis TaxID=1562110 RepID=UPI001F08CB71|nr:Wzz/FepE/Etk N-terminal domain-containing protein [Halomonas faecis]